MFFIILAPFAAGQASGQADVCRLIEAVLDGGSYLSFRADTVLSAGLPAGTTNVVCLDCNVAVNCHIPGSVIMVGGELGIRSRARVGGDVIIVGEGKVFRSRRAVVEGRYLKNESAQCLGKVRKRLKSSRGGSGFPLRVKPELGRLGGFALAGYDRVDGFSISWGFKLVQPGYHRSPLLEARAVSSTTRRAVGFDATLGWGFDRAGQYSLGLRVRSLTDTNDRWRLGDLENAFKAFFAGLDHRCYFRREGFTAFFRRRIGRASRIGIAFQDERYYSLASQSPFALFGGDQFRPNLPVDPGPIRSVLLDVLIDTRESLFASASGFRGRAVTELAGGELGGQHDFVLLDLSLKRWDTWGRRHHTFFWFKGVFADNILPFQRGYTLGNTLHGYDNFAFSGDRMLLFQASYGLGLPAPPVIDYLFFRWRVEGIYETGTAFFSGSSETGYNDLKHDVGVGVSGETMIGRLGIHVFQNLDKAERTGPRVTLSMDMYVFGDRR
ncbi:MAG: hypothetical protein U9P14_01470 [Gemmatimonadota bacterium]|nr:hypothetical protein [Gemmatimonadota bacterium]